MRGSTEPLLQALRHALGPRHVLTHDDGGADLSAWENDWRQRSQGHSLAIKVLPLVFPLPGLWRHRMYTYRWLSLLVWLYFTEGVVRATSERGTGALLASIEVVLCLLLFAACAVHVRWRLRAAKLTAP